MNVMSHPQAERETQRVQSNHVELVERIARAVRQDGTIQPLLADEKISARAARHFFAGNRATLAVVLEGQPIGHPPHSSITSSISSIN